MKTIFILTIAFLFAYLIIVGIPQTNSLLAACSGTYYLKESLDKNITNEEEAFQALKNYWRTFNPGCGVWIEDAIPSNMNFSEALTRGILETNQTIMLDTGQNVTEVWMIYQHRAIDKNGNVYFCKV